ncbi:MAG TPA: SCO family protein [Candidatus Binatia bacterium]|nr:SCO family protein [Candidatus Binatia bacterium]
MRICAIGALALLTACSAARQYSLAGNAVDMPASDFTLTDQDGKHFTLSQQRGKEVILFFGYTHCPDVCPTTLAALAAALQKLAPEQRARVRVAFVTVDPQRDDAATLRRYVRIFNPTFYGLTGTEAQLDPVYAAYHAWHQKLPGSPATGYLVAHGSTIYFIAPDGRLRVLHDWHDSLRSLTHDMKELTK